MPQPLVSNHAPGARLSRIAQVLHTEIDEVDARFDALLAQNARMRDELATFAGRLREGGARAVQPVSPPSLAVYAQDIERAAQQWRERIQAVRRYYLAIRPSLTMDERAALDARLNPSITPH